jgi:hypothetical protein
MENDAQKAGASRRTNFVVGLIVLLAVIAAAVLGLNVVIRMK